MLGKTHVSAGMAASLLVLHPVSIAPLACALLGGALGGWISDIDVRGAKLVRGTIVSACVVALAFASRFLAEMFSEAEALQAIAPEMGPASVAGAALFAGVTLFGSLTSHRTFTHSIVGCALWYVAACLFWPQVTPAFGIGLCSHLILDLLNKAPKGSMRLFFPLRVRVCLDVCRADGFANALVWSASVIVCVVYGGWLIFSRL